jgi:hypothetical protein
MDAPALAPTRFRKQTHVKAGTIWTPEEDDLLTKLVSDAETVSWCALVSYFPNKTAPQISGRWDKVINPRLVKGSWTREEDATIVTFVREHGDKDWAKLALLLEGRTGKQCRERYKNHLDDSVNHASWTPQEDRLLAELHTQYGNAWTRLASFFKGRTDNCIKNRWNSTVKKRIERIERGQPLVMKRGRKPRNEPMGAESKSGGEPKGDSLPGTVPGLELMPLNPRLRSKFGIPSPRQQLPSLEDAPVDMKQLLSRMPV